MLGVFGGVGASLNVCTGACGRATLVLLVSVSLSGIVRSAGAGAGGGAAGAAAAALELLGTASGSASRPVLETP